MLTATTTSVKRQPFGWRKEPCNNHARKFNDQTYHPRVQWFLPRWFQDLLAWGTYGQHGCNFPPINCDHYTDHYTIITSLPNWRWSRTRPRRPLRWQSAVSKSVYFGGTSEVECSLCACPSQRQFQKKTSRICRALPKSPTVFSFFPDGCGCDARFEKIELGVSLSLVFRQFFLTSFFPTSNVLCRRRCWRQRKEKASEERIGKYQF